MLPRAPVSALIVAGLLCLHHCTKANADDHADYKYEDYLEDHRRIHVETQSALFDADLLPWLTVRGEYVYDSISGATPTGAPPPPGSNQVPTSEMRDNRRAGFLETALHWDNQTITPQAAYSRESDYESIGVSLADAIDFNQKNTTLNLGLSHDFDHVIFTRNTFAAQNDPSLLNQRAHRDNSEFLAGVTQLLGPKTVLTGNLSLGVDSGDLSDPYRGAYFYDLPTLEPEARPRHRLSEVAYVQLTQFVTPLNGSIEASYRFYHDSYDIFAHTLSLAWLQKIGEQFVLSPSFRVYDQTAASFYAVGVPANVNDPLSYQLYQNYGVPLPANLPPPTYYSSDYRLSSFHSFTYGLSASWKINSHVYFDAAYKRYAMIGNDGVTSSSAYPKAHVLTIGARLWL